MNSAEQKKKDPYAYLDKYCEFDGNLLLSQRLVQKTSFDRQTGEAVEAGVYMRFCPKWQTNRHLHTESVREFRERAQNG